MPVGQNRLLDRFLAQISAQYTLKSNLTLPSVVCMKSYEAVHFVLVLTLKLSPRLPHYVV
jgi:hypothetical protein